MQNIRKIIGKFGRRYGGKPFKIIREWCYDAAYLCKKCREALYMALGKYPSNHRDERFYKKYYSGDSASEGNADSATKKAGIICMYDGRLYHGGPTDRIRGLLSTYKEAKKRGIPFYIHWVHPFRLENFLVPKDVDWRIESDDISYLKSEAFPVIIQDEIDFISNLKLKAGLCNKISQLHIYSNSDKARGEYRTLFNELFDKSDNLKAEVEKNKKKLGERYWAFTFRFLNLLGDFKEWSRAILSEDERQVFLERVTAEFLKLAKDVPEGYRILVTSDSRLFLDYVEKIDNRIYIVPGDVKNIDLLKGEFPDAWMKTFVDQQLLMDAEKVFLLRTGKMYKSGFPRFAAEVGGAEFIDYEF